MVVVLKLEPLEQPLRATADRAIHRQFLSFILVPSESLDYVNGQFIGKIIGLLKSIGFFVFDGNRCHSGFQCRLGEANGVEGVMEVKFSKRLSAP